MKIEMLRIQNFRAVRDDTIIFHDYSCLVGPNGSGKSTVLTALNIFFRETESAATNLVELSREDFHQCDTTEPIRLTVTFSDLSAEAAHDLKDYVRQGRLVVSAVAQWDGATQTAPVLQYGERLGISDFRKYFELAKRGAKAAELQKVYDTLRQTFNDLPPAKTKQEKEEALIAYELSHQDSCTLIPSEDLFYGFSRGSNRIEKYLQWVFVPAVKDATTEQPEAKSSAISKLLARRVHSQLTLDAPVDAIKQEALTKYRELLQSNQNALDNLTSAFNLRFRRWAHEDASLDLQWQTQDKAVSIAKPAAEVKAVEGLFKGDLARFGHGLQRSFIFTLLEELSEHTDDGPLLILGVEEPELFQHPPQARHLATVLQRLSARNAEVIICTHSPVFITGRTFENVRLASKGTDGSVQFRRATFERISEAVSAVTGDPLAKPGGMAAKIDQDMESPMNEMFFSGFRVFVEGLEDVAYISSYLTLLDKWDEFRAFGGHLIPVQGKNHLINALAIANEFQLPYFVVFDCDGDTPEDDPTDSARQTGRRIQHKRENGAIFTLTGYAGAEPFPSTAFVGSNITAWPTKLSDTVEAEITKAEITSAQQKVRDTYKINTKGMNKNGLFIGYTMAEVWAKDLKSASLMELCAAILCEGKKTKVRSPATKAEPTEASAAVP